MLSLLDFTAAKNDDSEHFIELSSTDNGKFTYKSFTTDIAHPSIFVKSCNSGGRSYAALSQPSVACVCVSSDDLTNNLGDDAIGRDAIGGCAIGDCGIGGSGRAPGDGGSGGPAIDGCIGLRGVC